MIKTRLQFLIGIIFFILSPATFGQVSNYWGESFSTKSALLSGAVVGGYQDESSIYYNPSILLDSSVNRFSFANGLATIDAIRYENALGDGMDVGNWESTVAPGFISLNLYPKKRFGLVWKAAFFNRTKYDNGVSSEVRETYDVFENSPGLENYMGRINVRVEYSDYWYGLGLAKRLNNKFSVGISFFARYTSTRYENQKLIEITGSDTSSVLSKVSASSSSLNLSGYAWRATSKIGFNYRISNDLRLGLTITTPSFTIVNGATVNKSEIRINIPDERDTRVLPDYLYDEYSDNLNLVVKDPLSISAGVDYTRNKFRWNCTVEWFASVSPYRSVDQSTGDVELTITEGVEIDPDNLSFAGGGNAVFNVAIGMEKFTSTGRSWLFGAKTDFSSQKNFDFGDLSDLNKVSSTTSDYYHFSAGKSFQFLNFDVLFGLQYSFSRTRGLQSFANFAVPVTFNPNDPYSLEGEPKNNMNFNGDALSIFVGLTLKRDK